MNLEAVSLNPALARPFAHFDVAIVGGGPVGAALALALRDSGLGVAVLEAKSDFFARDPRALALSQGTRLILERLGTWPRLAAQVTAITSIHVSQRGRIGRTLLEAQAFSVPALGYTAEYGDLYAALAADLPASGAELIVGAQVSAVRPASGCGLVEYGQAGRMHRLSARLIVLADGGKGVPGPVAVKDYGQSALICLVETELPHAQRAYERFTAQGPIALLPLDPKGSAPGALGAEYALVWTTPNEDLEARMQLSDRAFLAALQAAFGDRQGRFLACGSRSVFPLRLVTAQEPIKPGLVRVGNAAQTLHPVAGQGFNLGLRDAWWLAQTLLDTPRADLGTLASLERYRGLRRWDVGGGIAMTDVLVDLFANDLPGLSQGRGLALSVMDVVPVLKQAFARKMMFGVQAW